MPDSGQWPPGSGDPSLNEIRRVDRFFDALAADQHAYSTDSTEAELAFLLADWRDSIREPAVTTPVTARDAVAALQNGLHRKESRTSLTIVGSVAAALLCLGGFGTAIYAAGPNSSLYGLHTAMFGAEKASRDDQVMLAAQTEMQQVQQLIDNGQWQQAQEKLQALSPTVQSVDAPEHKQQLIQQWNALTYKVVEQNPAATLPPPGEPMPVLPSSPLTLLPVPVVETTSSSTSSSSTSTTTSSTTSSTTATSTDTSTTSSSTSTSPSESTSTSSSTSATSPTETAGSSSASSSSVTSSPSSSASTATSAPSTVPSTATATATATVPSSEPVVTKPPTATATQTATVAPSTQNPAPAQTVTTVAPTVEVPSVTTPAPTAPAVQPTVAPTTKEAQPEPTRERSVVTTTQAPSGSGRGEH
ncbi:MULTISPECIES: anti-sigma-D factor RsdA [unclassified Mycobacterium]|uniref:anti-sigma-D factor RsdA n=1 Tax=unclassified Mycobacterium TaxID=2642494 RepID=UPI000567989A|nr:MULTISPECIES: anti-sigma-D factor RsdA [unclassified Mycobacterium]SEB25314.1 Anti-sigma-D factor RsdA to sigma factor binding region [Mycobacterium sp. 283mftsu]